MADLTDPETVAQALNCLTTAPRFAASYAAAEAAVAKRCRWPEDEKPADLVQSVILRTARYMARANSPDGMVGMGEMGPQRVAQVDRDIERLEWAWRPVVFG